MVVRDFKKKSWASMIPSERHFAESQKEAAELWAEFILRSPPVGDLSRLPDEPTFDDIDDEQEHFPTLVTTDGEEIVLTAKEFDLLWFFARHPRQVFSRTQLLDQVWGYDFFGDESTVTVHIRRLREKVEADPSNPAYIHTVWGVGYKFEAP